MPSSFSINLDEVKSFSKLMHKSQEYNGKSYFDGHLIPVLEVVQKYSDDTRVHAASLLHDVMEDCGVPFDYIESAFGLYVAILVEAVTDEPGETRKERKSKTYQKIAPLPDAVLIKLADRLINTSGEKKDMYKKEFPEFKQALYKAGQWEELWKKLEEISV